MIMKIFKRCFLLIFTLFLFISNIGALAQNPTASARAKAGIKGDNLAILGSQNIDPSFEKEIETIVERSHEKNHKNSDKILINAQWIITAVIAIVTFLIALLFYISYRYISDKSEEAISNIQIKLNEKLNELHEKIDESEKDVNNKIKNTQAYTYYNIAIASLNKKRYSIALEFLLDLYSSNYRLRDVCYHIGICYKNLEEPDYPQALKFFEKARKEVSEGKIGLIKTIEREIDETRALLKKIVAHGYTENRCSCCNP